MYSKTVEIGVGVFVAMGLAALLMLAMKVSNLAELTAADGYQVTARFDNIGGLKVRAPVTMSGVRVGRVTQIDFDDSTYEAVVRFSIDPRYMRIPLDTSASIYTAGLLGEQYIGLEAGGDENFLADGDEITLTQSAIVLEQVIGQFLYSKAAEGGS
ncbi:MAG: outer membrane lipid asymmetry maintenance protein MlaD [Gammaproteobacteria bacterium]|nr:outer membrane lipid asymmetry maintenance protein MlaD [Gammaproteobacteria bacterium]NIM71633.1 outer membrane lipid asymmetry maintenance protein MlaD [Gammaproteobacteria bacterium]NIO23373.1 outer membrane lipid asymmetry maintenance protein MlaD [Gammaproteobacteria bacterium]NIO64001.1 outer membrane lipid asymmetry maintenance protein MlaD [Gammaproteobacteria bacterium]NIP47112.1 outer membrane lipid asymmetry maintenance protein MlaD [Gammaproteobacteria bacterium]